MTDFQGLYEIRKAVEDDHAYIYSSFLNGLYYGNNFFRLIPKDLFMQKYKLVVCALIHHPNVLIHVACLKEDLSVIIGYSIIESNNRIHWVSVKSTKLADGSSWRRHGIAKSLIPNKPISVSHLTTLGLKLLPKLKDCIFDPFL